MSSVRDFSPEGPSLAVPVRQRTSLSPGDSGVPPDARRNSDTNRRASVNSHVSVAHSILDNVTRHRRLSRAATVNTTTYHEPDQAHLQPGAEPGIDTKAAADSIPAHLANLNDDCQVTIVDYSDNDKLESSRSQHDLAHFLEQPRPDGFPCRWISVNGLNWEVIKALGNKYNLHRLAIEDLTHTRTRTKVDWYKDHAFIVLTLQKLVRLHGHKGRSNSCDCQQTASDPGSDEKLSEKLQHRKTSLSGWWAQDGDKHPPILPRYTENPRNADGHDYVLAHSGLSDKSAIKPIRTLHRYESASIPKHTAFMEEHSVLTDRGLAVSVEQVCIFLLADNTVISFFEHSADDVESPILERLQGPETMLRRSSDASLLVQALIDTIVDIASAVRDAYNKSRKELQIDAMTNPDIRTSRALHIFGEEIDMLQNLFKPIVHLVNALRDHQIEPLRSYPSASSIAMGLSGGSATPEWAKMQHPQGPRRADTATRVAISPLAHIYFGDVLDNCITTISALEQMDASANNISTLIFNTVGAKTNYFMMILATVTVFFAPLTFISGYFGMNFASGSGLDHPFSFFWIVAIPSLVGFMLVVYATLLWDNIQDFFARRKAKNGSVRKSFKF